MPSLTFLGAAGTVTGSKHLLDTGDHRMLVDCGLFQGLKELRERNWQPLPIAADGHRRGRPDPRAPRSLRLSAAARRAGLSRPRVLHAGHRRTSARIVLPDSAQIQEEDAREANRQRLLEAPARRCRSTPRSDAARALTQLQPVGYDRPVPVAPGVEVEFINAGHLLGSAYARVRLQDGKTILFGGDLGRYGRPVLPDPSPVDEADVLLVESTYGDRLHEPTTTASGSREIVNDTAARGGKLIIPAFAIGRVEEVLYWLKRLEDARPDSRAAGLRRQPDGARRRCSSTPSATDELDAEMQPADATRRRRRSATHARCRRCASRAAVERARRASRRARRSSSRRAAWRPAAACCTISRRRCPTRGTPCSSSAIQAAGTRGRLLVDGAHDGEDPRAAMSRSPRASSASIRCRRTPTRRDHALAWRASSAAARRPVSCTASRLPMDALQDAHRAERAGRHVPAPGTGQLELPSAGCRGRHSAVDAHAQPASTVRSEARPRRGRPPYLLEQRRRAAVVQLYADGFDALPLDARRCWSGTSTRRRSPAATSTTTSATRTTSRCATSSKRSSRTRQASIRRRSTEIRALHQAVLDQHRSATTT